MLPNDQDRIEQGACIAVIIITIMIALSLQVRGDELHDRAAAAIAIHNAIESNPWLPPVTPAKPDVPSPPKEKSEPKSVVTLYSATWCAPCRQAKADLKAADLPFTVKIQDVSNGGQPAFVESLPWVSWPKEGGVWQMAYPGVKPLVESWRKTQKQTNEARGHPANRWPSMQGYRSRWTWPGDLRHHLQSTHGVGEAKQLTQDQAEALHDALHEGHSLNQIRSKLSK